MRETPIIFNVPRECKSVKFLLINDSLWGWFVKGFAFTNGFVAFFVFASLACKLIDWMSK